MPKDTEPMIEVFKPVKEEMTIGLSSPDMMADHITLYGMLFMLPSVVFSAFIIFWSNEVGWGNVPMFWQRFYLIQIPFLLYLYFLILPLPVIHNGSQLMILISYILFLVNTVLAILSIPFIFAIDYGIYEAFARLLMAFTPICLFLAMMYMLLKVLGFMYHRKGASKLAYRKLRRIILLAQLGMVCMFVWRNFTEIQMIVEADIGYFLLVGLIVMMIGALGTVLPVLSIFFFFVFPSYRIEANEQMYSDDIKKTE